MNAIRASILIVVFVSAAVTSGAAAHVNPGGYRLWIDADLFSAGVVRLDPSGAPAPVKTPYIGIGPNQLGGSRVVLPTTPVGLGYAHVLRRDWLLGARLGMGYDRISPKDAEPTSTVALSVMPELTFVPLGHDAKLFVKFSPVLQYNAEKRGDTKQRIFMGCFSFGVGTFLFTSHTSSIDIGAYFEGRFGDLNGAPNGRSVDVNDLRAVVRGGVSLWR